MIYIKEPKNDNNTTHIICILDRSGSMEIQASEVISNFNHFLKEQQSIDGDASLTLVLFDDKYEIVYDQLPLKEVPPLTTATYFTRGLTAMNDAIGRTLNNMQNHNKAIVLIHTDGYENASREYTYDSVNTLVNKLNEKWEFIFVGGGIDSKKVASSIGVHMYANVTNDSLGNSVAYNNFSTATTAYRSDGLVGTANVKLKSNN